MLFFRNFFSSKSGAFFVWNVWQFIFWQIIYCEILTKHLIYILCENFCCHNLFVKIMQKGRFYFWKICIKNNVWKTCRIFWGYFLHQNVCTNFLHQNVCINFLHKIFAFFTLNFFIFTPKFWNFYTKIFAFFTPTLHF